eukprot:1421215-Amphidinium_carterae.1
MQTYGRGVLDRQPMMASFREAKVAQRSAPECKPQLPEGSVTLEAPSWTHERNKAARTYKGLQTGNRAHNGSLHFKLDCAGSSDNRSEE